MSHSRQQGAREFYETLQRNKDAADRRISALTGMMVLAARGRLPH